MTDHNAPHTHPHPTLAALVGIAMASNDASQDGAQMFTALVAPWDNCVTGLGVLAASLALAIASGESYVGGEAIVDTIPQHAGDDSTPAFVPLVRTLITHARQHDGDGAMDAWYVACTEAGEGMYELIGHTVSALARTYFTVVTTGQG